MSRKSSLEKLFAGFNNRFHIGSASASKAATSMTPSYSEGVGPFRPSVLPTAASSLKSNLEAPVTYAPEHDDIFRRYPDELELAKLLASKGGLSGLRALEHRITDNQASSYNNLTLEPSSNSIDLHLVRHAETEHNLARALGAITFKATLPDGTKMVYDRGNPEHMVAFSNNTLLSGEGRTQARRLHRRLPPAVDHVLLSTKIRTELTCIPALPVKRVDYDDAHTKMSGRYTLHDDSIITWSKTSLADEFDWFHMDNAEQTERLSEHIQDLARSGKKSILHFGHGGVIATLAHRLENEHYIAQRTLSDDGTVQGVDPAIRYVSRPGNTDIWSFRLELEEETESQAEE